MNAQQTIYEAVAARGYTHGWTDGQFAFRQLLKLVEELAEAAGHISGDWPSDRWMEFVGELEDLGNAARRLFDARQSCSEILITVDDPVAYGKELADCQVVLACAGQVADRLGAGAGAPFDVIDRAVRKATADIPRGIR